jgi:hypothetical protein
MALLKVRQPKRAVVAFSKVIALGFDSPTKDKRTLLDAVSGVARGLEAMKKAKASRQVLALLPLVKAGRPELAQARLSLARVLWSVGNREESVVLARKAAASFLDLKEPARHLEAVTWLKDKGFSPDLPDGPRPPEAGREEHASAG